MYVMAPHCQHAPHRNHTRTPNGSDRTHVKRGGKTHSVSAGPTGSDESTIITSNLRPLLASSYNQTDSLLRLLTMHTSASRRHVRKKNRNKKEEMRRRTRTRLCDATKLCRENLRCPKNFRSILSNQTKLNASRRERSTNECVRENPIG
jgi:hypothetical protein